MAPSLMLVFSSFSSSSFEKCNGHVESGERLVVAIHLDMKNRDERFFEYKRGMTKDSLPDERLLYDCCFTEKNTGVNAGANSDATTVVVRLKALRLSLEGVETAKISLNGDFMALMSAEGKLRLYSVILQSYLEWERENVATYEWYETPPSATALAQTHQALCIRHNDQKISCSYFTVVPSVADTTPSQSPLLESSPPPPSSPSIAAGVSLVNQSPNSSKDIESEYHGVAPLVSSSSYTVRIRTCVLDCGTIKRLLLPTSTRLADVERKGWEITQIHNESSCIGLVTNDPVSVAKLQWGIRVTGDDEEEEYDHDNYYFQRNKNIGVEKSPSASVIVKHASILWGSGRSSASSILPRIWRRRQQCSSSIPTSHAPIDKKDTGGDNGIASSSSPSTSSIKPEEGVGSMRPMPISEQQRILLGEKTIADDYNDLVDISLSKALIAGVTVTGGVCIWSWKGGLLHRFIPASHIAHSVRRLQRSLSHGPLPHTLVGGNGNHVVPGAMERARPKPNFAGMYTSTGRTAMTSSCPPLLDLKVVSMMPTGAGPDSRPRLSPATYKRLFPALRICLSPDDEKVVVAAPENGWRWLIFSWFICVYSHLIIAGWEEMAILDLGCSGLGLSGIPKIEEEEGEEEKNHHENIDFIFHRRGESSDQDSIYHIDDDEDDNDNDGGDDDDGGLISEEEEELMQDAFQVDLATEARISQPNHLLAHRKRWRAPPHALMMQGGGDAPYVLDTLELDAGGGRGAIWAVQIPTPQAAMATSVLHKEFCAYGALVMVTPSRRRRQALNDNTGHSDVTTHLFRKQRFLPLPTSVQERGGPAAPHVVAEDGLYALVARQAAERIVENLQTYSNLSSSNNNHHLENNNNNNNNNNNSNGDNMLLDARGISVQLNNSEIVTNTAALLRPPTKTTRMAAATKYSAPAGATTTKPGVVGVKNITMINPSADRCGGGFGGGDDDDDDDGVILEEDEEVLQGRVERIELSVEQLCSLNHWDLHKARMSGLRKALSLRDLRSVQSSLVELQKPDHKHPWQELKGCNLLMSHISVAVSERALFSDRYLNYLLAIGVGYSSYLIRRHSQELLQEDDKRKSTGSSGLALSQLITEAFFRRLRADGSENLESNSSNSSNSSNTADDYAAAAAAASSEGDGSNNANGPPLVDLIVHLSGRLDRLRPLQAEILNFSSSQRSSSGSTAATATGTIMTYNNREEEEKIVRERMSSSSSSLSREASAKEAFPSSSSSSSSSHRHKRGVMLSSLSHGQNGGRTPTSSNTSNTTRRGGTPTRRNILRSLASLGGITRGRRSPSSGSSSISAVIAGGSSSSSSSSSSSTGKHGDGGGGGGGETSRKNNNVSNTGSSVGMMGSTTSSLSSSSSSSSSSSFKIAPSVINWYTFKMEVDAVIKDSLLTGRLSAAIAHLHRLGFGTSYSQYKQLTIPSLPSSSSSSRNRGGSSRVSSGSRGAPPIEPSSSRRRRNGGEVTGRLEKNKAGATSSFASSPSGTVTIPTSSYSTFDQSLALIRYTRLSALQLPAGHIGWYLLEMSPLQYLIQHAGQLIYHILCNDQMDFLAMCCRLLRIFGENEMAFLHHIAFTTCRRPLREKLLRHLSHSYLGMWREESKQKHQRILQLQQATSEDSWSGSPSLPPTACSISTNASNRKRRKTKQGLRRRRHPVSSSSFLSSSSSSSSSHLEKYLIVLDQTYPNPCYVSAYNRMFSVYLRNVFDGVSGRTPQKEKVEAAQGGNKGGRGLGGISSSSSSFFAPTLSVLGEECVRNLAKMHTNWTWEDDDDDDGDSKMRSRRRRRTRGGDIRSGTSFFSSSSSKANYYHYYDQYYSSQKYHHDDEDGEYPCIMGSPLLPHGSTIVNNNRNSIRTKIPHASYSSDDQKYGFRNSVDDDDDDYMMSDDDNDVLLSDEDEEILLLSQHQQHQEARKSSGAAAPPPAAPAGVITSKAGGLDSAVDGGSSTGSTGKKKKKKKKGEHITNSKHAVEGGVGGDRKNAVPAPSASPSSSSSSSWAGSFFGRSGGGGGGGGGGGRGGGVASLSGSEGSSGYGYGYYADSFDYFTNSTFLLHGARREKFVRTGMHNVAEKVRRHNAAITANLKRWRTGDVDDLQTNPVFLLSFTREDIPPAGAFNPRASMQSSLIASYNNNSNSKASPSSSSSSSSSSSLAAIAATAAGKGDDANGEGAEAMKSSDKYEGRVPGFDRGSDSCWVCQHLPTRSRPPLSYGKVHGAGYLHVSLAWIKQWNAKTRYRVLMDGIHNRPSHHDEEEKTKEDDVASSSSSSSSSSKNVNHPSTLSSLRQLAFRIDVDVDEKKDHHYHPPLSSSASRLFTIGVAEAELEYFLSRNNWKKVLAWVEHAAAAAAGDSKDDVGLVEDDEYGRLQLIYHKIIRSSSSSSSSSNNNNNNRLLLAAPKIVQMRLEMATPPLRELLTNALASRGVFLPCELPLRQHQKLPNGKKQMMKNKPHHHQQRRGESNERKTMATSASSATALPPIPNFMLLLKRLAKVYENLEGVGKRAIIELGYYDVACISSRRRGKWGVEKDDGRGSSGSNNVSGSRGISSSDKKTSPSNSLPAIQIEVQLEALVRNRQLCAASLLQARMLSKAKHPVTIHHLFSKGHTLAALGTLVHLPAPVVPRGSQRGGGAGPSSSMFRIDSNYDDDDDDDDDNDNDGDDDDDDGKKYMTGLAMVQLRVLRAFVDGRCSRDSNRRSSPQTTYWSTLQFYQQQTATKKCLDYVHYLCLGQPMKAYHELYASVGDEETSSSSCRSDPLGIASATPALRRTRRRRRRGKKAGGEVANGLRRAGGGGGREEDDVPGTVLRLALEKLGNPIIEQGCLTFLQLCGVDTVAWRVVVESAKCVYNHFATGLLETYHDMRKCTSSSSSSKGGGLGGGSSSGLLSSVKKKKNGSNKQTLHHNTASQGMMQGTTMEEDEMYSYIHRVAIEKMKKLFLPLLRLDSNEAVRFIPKQHARITTVLKTFAARCGEIYASSGLVAEGKGEEEKDASSGSTTTTTNKTDAAYEQKDEEHSLVLLPYALPAFLLYASSQELQGLLSLKKATAAGGGVDNNDSTHKREFEEDNDNDTDDEKHHSGKGEGRRRKSVRIKTSQGAINFSLETFRLYCIPTPFIAQSGEGSHYLGEWHVFDILYSFENLSCKVMLSRPPPSAILVHHPLASFSGDTEANAIVSPSSHGSSSSSSSRRRRRSSKPPLVKVLVERMVRHAELLEKEFLQCNWGSKEI
eukprot:jgi/Bigna1/83342/fgenesh1_pg.106_\